MDKKELERLIEQDKKIKARYKRQNELSKNYYDRLSLAIPKGKKDEIKAAADRLGVSVNQFINDAINQALDQ